MNPRDKVALDIYRTVQPAVVRAFIPNKHDQEVTVEWLSPQVQLLRVKRMSGDRTFMIRISELSE